MKKILTTIALSGLAGASIANAFDGLTLKGRVGFENEYIYRGKEHSQENIQTKVVGEYALPVAGGGLAIYGGAFLMSPLTQSSNEAILFTGLKTQIEDFIIEGGYTYYGYPNRNSTYSVANVGGAIDPRNNRAIYSDSNEINIAAAYNGFSDVVTPSLSVAYNFELEQLTAEVALRRNFDLGQLIGANGFEISLAAYAGYLDSRRYNGNQRAAGIERWYNAYAYAGGTADIAYNINPGAKVGVGVRYAYNNDGKGEDSTPLGGDNVNRLAGNTSHNVYYGVWAEFRY